MQSEALADRRRFLQLAAGIATGTLLSGCGGGKSSGRSDAVTVVAATPTTMPADPPPLADGSHRLNLALNLAYLGAAFYGAAAGGTGLSAALTGGIGRSGVATGARAATFTDAAIRGYAAELAADKQAHVAALRAGIGATAAAQPVMDLSALPTSAFSVAAQRAGIVAAGASFDPYLGDTEFLLGAFLIEDTVAAAYRTLLLAGGDTASPLLAANLADAIYHGGLIRSLLDARTAGDATAAAALAKAASFLASLDGGDPGSRTLSDATAAGADIVDAAGRPIPFTREPAQVLRMLYLSGSGGGGFLPAGANGVPV